MEKTYRAELTGVFGDPVDGNPTGIMEEAGFAALNLNYRYLTIQVKEKDLKAAFDGAKAMNMRGINLTMPHKISIIPFLDQLSEAACIIGAVNTVVYDKGTWLGENTDGKGFVLSLKREGLSLNGRTVTILGAGGAARAIAVECALAGASKIIIINRSKEHGQTLASLISTSTKATSTFLCFQPGMDIPSETNVLVQATSIGLHPAVDEKPDINYHSISSAMTVCDVVFNPVMPAFLKQAEKRGAQTITGIGMLVQQGALNFELWTGEKAPVDVMYHTLHNEFNL